VSAARPVNLCFHGIGTPRREREPGEELYWISPDFFLAILDLVRERDDVRLSFDDGNASDVEIGLPALRERGLDAAFYPVAQRIDTPGSLRGSDLRDLVAAGMTVGSHGMRHIAWRGLPEVALTEELVSARGVIAAAAGVAVETAACPLGSYDRRVLSRMLSLGYTRVFTSDRATAGPRAWLQPRFSIRHTDDIDSVRAILDRGPGRARRMKAAARIAVKRWR
jgi:peptidoglycan/xylan/chitin deacetylase (PgdA/CDA1 family)